MQLFSLNDQFSSPYSPLDLLCHISWMRRPVIRVTCPYIVPWFEPSFNLHLEKSLIWPPPPPCVLWSLLYNKPLSLKIGPTLCSLQALATATIPMFGRANFSLFGGPRFKRFGPVRYSSVLGVGTWNERKRINEVRQRSRRRWRDKQIVLESYLGKVDQEKER